MGTETPSDTADDWWTVIGFWLSDTPISAGVVGGRHEVYGGEECQDGYIPGESFRGPWATATRATGPDEAEQLAVQVMLDVQAAADRLALGEDDEA